MDLYTDRFIDGLVVRWFDGLMDQLIGGPVEGRKIQIECLYEIESEDYVIIVFRSTSFEISSCAIDLVDGAQCKGKRKR